MRNPHKQENRPTSACAMARCIAIAEYKPPKSGCIC